MYPPRSNLRRYLYLDRFPPISPNHLVLALPAVNLTPTTRTFAPTRWKPTSRLIVAAVLAVVTVAGAFVYRIPAS
jgi:hypothetical protein